MCGHCYNYEAAVHNEYRGLYWAVDDTTVNDNEDVCAPVIPKPPTYLSHDELSGEKQIQFSLQGAKNFLQ